MSLLSRGWFSPLLFVIYLAPVNAVPPAAAGRPATFSHDDWTVILSRFVDSRGLVAYQALARDRATLDRYLAALERVGPETDPDLFPTRDHRLAYYLNAYNALVFQGVLERGPEERSIWRGGVVSGYRFFVGRKFVLAGEKINLKKLEDKTIREGFEDARIHAALNCASMSCPRLPRRAFDPLHLDRELDAAMRDFVGDEQHVRLAGETVYLSKIFDWFSKDFLDHERRQGNDAPVLLDYVNRYRSSAAQIERHTTVKFLKYDKGINQQ